MELTKKLFILLLFVPLLVGCHRTKPQAPSDGFEPDTMLQTLITIHQRLALEADEQLAHYAAANPGFVRDSSGIWMRKTLKAPDADSLRDLEAVMIDVRMRSLNDSVDYGSLHQVVTLGKKEVPAALETALRQMRHGEKAVVLAPWYQYYGREGKGKVPPYEQVVIQLIVNN